MALTRLHSTRDFFRIWFYWKFQAGITFLTIVGLIMLFSYVYTPDYDSFAKILLLPRTGEGTVISAGTDEKRVALISTEDVNTEIELLTSDEVIKKTVMSFAKAGGLSLKAEKSWLGKIMDLAKQGINEMLIFVGLKERLTAFDSNVILLRESLEIEPVAMSNIILVTLTAERPKAAEVVLNRFLQIYVNQHEDVFSKNEGVQFFSTQADEFRNELESAEKKYQKLQNDSKIVDLKRQNDSNIELIADLKISLNNIEILTDELKNKMAIFKNSQSENDKEVLITKEMRTIPSIVRIEEGIVPLIIKRSEIKKSYTPSSREYQDINSQIEMLGEDVKNEIKKAIKTDKLELDSLLMKQTLLQDKIQKLQEESLAFNQKERELKEIERQVKLYENNYMLYAAKTEDARIQSDKKKRDLSSVSIADPATLPVKIAFPIRLLMLVISLIVGFFAAIGIPFFLEFLDHRIKTSYEIEDLLSLPVICSLPLHEMKS